MPIILSAGVSKKMGLPNYGSLGATCQVQVELDAGLLEHDLEGLHQRVRDVYVACSQAVNNELDRHRQAMDVAASASQHESNSSGQKRADGHMHTHTKDTPGDNGRPLFSGEAHTDGRENQDVKPGEDGNRDGQPGQTASPRQIDYLHVLAGQIRGLGVRRLATLSENRCGKPLVGLKAEEASRLIDLLKDVRAGRVALAEALNGGVL